jgi:hypothetical protein
MTLQHNKLSRMPSISAGSTILGSMHISLAELPEGQKSNACHHFDIVNSDSTLSIFNSGQKKTLLTDAISTKWWSTGFLPLPLAGP